MIAAGYVRGYSGFGFAAILVAGGGLVTDPCNLLAVVVIADLVMTAGQLRGLWPDIELRRVGAIFAGALVGVPVGVAAVARVGEDGARLVISVTILGMCAVLLAGWRLSRQPGTLAHAGVGAVSGLAQAGTLGGLPVAAFFAAQPLPAAAFRATIVGYFCLLDLWSLPNFVAAGLVTGDTLRATVLGLPLMVAGLLLGSRRFHGAAPAEFRRFAVLLLAGLALLGLVRSLA